LVIQIGLTMRAHIIREIKTNKNKSYTRKSKHSECTYSVMKQNLV